MVLRCCAPEVYADTDERSAEAGSKLRPAPGFSTVTTMSPMTSASDDTTSK